MINKDNNTGGLLQECTLPSTICSWVKLQHSPLTPRTPALHWGPSRLGAGATPFLPYTDCTANHTPLLRRWRPAVPDVYLRSTLSLRQRLKLPTRMKTTTSNLTLLNLSSIPPPSKPNPFTILTSRFDVRWSRIEWCNCSPSWSLATCGSTKVDSRLRAGSTSSKLNNLLAPCVLHGEHHLAKDLPSKRSRRHSFSKTTCSPSSPYSSDPPSTHHLPSSLPLHDSALLA